MAARGRRWGEGQQQQLALAGCRRAARRTCCSCNSRGPAAAAAATASREKGAGRWVRAPPGSCVDACACTLACSRCVTVCVYMHGHAGREGTAPAQCLAFVGLQAAARVSHVTHVSSRTACLQPAPHMLVSSHAAGPAQRRRRRTRMQSCAKQHRCAHACVSVCLCVRMHPCVHVCLCVRMRADMCVCACVLVLMHMHTPKCT